MVLMEEKVQFTQTWHRNRTPLFDRVNIDMEIPARPPTLSIGYPITWVIYAFLFSSFLFPFFPSFVHVEIVSVEWPDLSSYCPLNFYSSVFSDLVFVN